LQGILWLAVNPIHQGDHRLEFRYIQSGQYLGDGRPFFELKHARIFFTSRRKVFSKIRKEFDFHFHVQNLAPFCGS